MINELVTIGDFKMPLSKFIDMLATQVAKKIKDSNRPELISQLKAYKKYGRRNIETWVRNGELDIIETTTRRKYIRVDNLEEVASGRQYIR